MDTIFDLLIIGGGINGTAIARDAAGRGLSVLLCEKDDLATHTSSASTKLIHGGLRYLEYYEFRLVREALKEREVLLRAAPHIIWPMRFVLPYDKGLRPAWLLRLGLFFYDYMGGRKLLPPTKTVKLNAKAHENILEKRLTFGFEYSDCWVEDARLVVLNAMDARNHGADIRTRSEVKDLSVADGLYTAHIHTLTGTTEQVKARAVVNSAGPWVEEVLYKLHRGKNDAGLRLIKGSHIVTKKLYEGDHSYIFQNADNRIIFAIPYEGEYTLIGTTDVPYTARLGDVKISEKEISYLCACANEYFEKDISPEDVVWTYSGVRPLYDDKSANAAAVTRDYVLDIDEFTKGAPFMSIYGGKITTSRKLAEHAMEKLHPFLTPDKTAWTRTASLPGGDIANADFDGFKSRMTLQYPWLDPTLLHRLARSYGTHMQDVLGPSKTMSDLGRLFYKGLSEREVRYLIDREFVTSAQDILWRRSKLGLHMPEDERIDFINWFDETHTPASTSS